MPKRELSSDITGRKHFGFENKSNVVLYKLENDIYLLTCIEGCGQDVGESITPLYKRIKLHIKGKSGCEDY